MTKIAWTLFFGWLVVISNITIAQDGENTIVPKLTSQNVDELIFDNIELDQYISGLTIDWSNAELIQPLFEKYAIVAKFAEKPAEGSLLKPSWKLSKVKAIGTKRIFFLQGFQPNKTYLLQFGIVGVSAVKDEMEESDFKWWSNETEFKTSKIFNNVNLVADEGSIQVQWALDYDILDQLEDYGIFIAHNTAIGEKRNKSGYTDSDWETSAVLPINTLNYEIN